jgi:hypothetical protein
MDLPVCECLKEPLSLLAVSLLSECNNHFKDSAIVKNGYELTIDMPLWIPQKWKCKDKLISLKNTGLLPKIESSGLLVFK